MSTTRPKPSLALLLAAALYAPALAQDQPPDTARDPGGLYADPPGQPAERQPEADPEGEPLPVGQSIEFERNTASTYHFRAESAGMLTVMINARGGIPQIQVRGGDGRVHAEVAGHRAQLNGQLQVQAGRGGFGLDDFNVGGPVALSRDGSAIAMALPIPAAGVYQVTFNAVGENNADRLPTAGAQWLAMPQISGRVPIGPAVPGGPAEPGPVDDPVNAEPAVPPAGPMTAENIRQRATALTPGERFVLNRFERDDTAWLSFAAEQPGVLVLTVRSDTADIQLGFHEPNQLDDPFLYVDSDRMNDLGNEAAIVPVDAGQELLIHVFAYGRDQRDRVRVRAVFVPDEQEEGQVEEPAEE